jgi:hypothetical protein
MPDNAFFCLFDGMPDRLAGKMFDKMPDKMHNMGA